MTLTLSITDNQNGSGATASVVGSDGGSVNTIYAVNVPSITLGIAAPSWLAVGNRVGDGTLSLPVAPGYYWAYGTATVGGLPVTSTPVLFAATPNALSWWDQIANAAQAKIQTLGMTRIAPKNVFVRMLPSDVLEAYPCVYLCEEDEQESLQVSMNVTDDKEYPIRLFVKDRADVKFDNRRQQEINLWRQTLITAFENQRLPGVPSVYTCNVRPTIMIDPKLPQYQFCITGMTLRFVNREIRLRG